MSRRPRSAALLLSLATLVVAAEAEVVLLHNGSMLEGAVERTADTVAVHGDGSLIRLRTTDVACVVDSPIAAYEWRRAQTGRGAATAFDHLELAEWALLNRLWPQAARELLDARVLAPRSRRLVLLERRLDELSRPATVAEPEPKPPTNEPPLDAPADPTPALALPDGALELFTRRVQPVLLNSCATAGCHGPGGAPGMELDLASLHGYGDARSTERNLNATIAAIDPDQPTNSPLLIAARGPHAGVTPIVGTRRDEMLERLERWVVSVVAYNRPQPSSDDSTPGEAAVTAAPAPTVAPKPAAAPAVDSGAETEPDWEAIVAADKPTPPKHGVQLKRVEPRDDFDPEVFNARYRRPQDDEPLDETR